MPPTGGPRAVQGRSPGPRHPLCWVRLPSQESCPAVPASEPPAWAAPSLTHHGEAGVSGARGSRFLRRRQQLQLELRRASAPPHSLPAARAAAAASRPNGPSTAAARAPRLARPRPALPACRRTAAPADPSAPHSALTRPRISRARPTQSRALLPAARARAPAAGLLSVAARSAPLRPLYLPPRRRGTGRRRVTRPCVSRAAIGPRPWRK